MIQQINLFHAALTQNSGVKSLNYYLSGFILVMVLLATYSGFIFWHTSNLQSQLEIRLTEFKKAEKHLQLLQLKYPKQQVNLLLAAEITQAQDKLKAVSKIINLLTDQQTDQTQGFSKYWFALAKQSQKEIWLNKISIEIEPQNLTLEGSTFEPETVASLLQGLQNEAVFQGKNFTTLSMQESQSQLDQIDFTLSTQAIEALQP
jgi:hypothetical protein